MDNKENENFLNNELISDKNDNLNEPINLDIIKHDYSLKNEIDSINNIFDQIDSIIYC